MHRLEWRDGWRRFHVAEYIATGVFTVGLGVALFVPLADDVGWGGNALDTGFRDRVALGTRARRETAATVSDLLWLSAGAYTLVVDTLLVPLILDRNWDVTLQMGMISAQSLIFSAFAWRLVSKVLSRNRPLAERCATDPDYSPACGTRSEVQSFFSGHTTMAFTGAGLVCAHHGRLPLYGGGAGDVVACIGGLAVATTVGALRILADRHYLTDVLVGATVGLVSGWLMPAVLHYGFGFSPGTATRPRAMLVPFGSPELFGLAIAGVM